MLDIQFATENDIPAIRQIAHITWQNTYRHIITPLQMDMMLEEMYSKEALLQQFKSGDRFAKAIYKDQILGFVSFRNATDSPTTIFISKLYVLPKTHGLGMGKSLIEFVSNIALQENKNQIELNVNRFNKALYFYRRNGFYIHQSIDRPYHQFELNDYVMRKFL